MENYSAINPLLLSQPSSAETIKNLRQGEATNNTAHSLQKASQDFESILVNFVIDAMWKTIPKSGLFDENTAGMETYTEMMHTALAHDIVSKGGFGVASVIYKQLMHEKEIAGKPQNALFLTRDKNIIREGKKTDANECVRGNNEKDTTGVNPS